MVLVRFGWTVFSVKGMKPDSLTVLLDHWVPMTVHTSRMLG
jgi:hypothetical protein